MLDEKMAADVEYRYFVSGLACATTNQTLREAFSQFGNVSESKIINDRETGRSRGFEFVTFKDEQAMRDAIEGMNGQDLDGRNITVNKSQFRGSSGGYGGGGRHEGSGGYRGGRCEGGCVGQCGYRGGRREGGYSCSSGGDYGGGDHYSYCRSRYSRGGGGGGASDGRRS